MSKVVRRLVDYFYVVTYEEKLSNAENTPGNSKATAVSTAESNGYNGKKPVTGSSSVPEFQPIIAARYPIEDHEGAPLHEGVTCFCYPQGNVRLRKLPSLPKVHYFVTTGAKGLFMYGTCLTIYEPYHSSTPTNESNEKYYLPKCVCLLSSFPYLIAFREYLIQLHRLVSGGEMSMPIERFITNICHEVPAPPPGSFEVQTSILDSVITFWSLPHNLPEAWVSLPFSILFECLNTDNILTIWLALVLERQILFTSSQLSVLTLCCEILTSLLFPLKWCHAYIPVLPKSCIQILSAPTPFLCGIHKENLPEALLNVSSECIIVDLDKNHINMGPMTPDIPCLPLDYEDALRYILEKNAGRYFREARSLTKNENLFEKGVPLANDLKKIGQAVWESRLMLYDDASTLIFTDKAKSDYLNGSTGLGPDFLVDPTQKNESQAIKKQSNWDAVQEAFLSFFICALRNYREYMIYPSKAKDAENVTSYGGAEFREKNFVKSERHDMRDFLNQLLGTQMWDRFVTKRLYGSGSPDIIFFDDSVNQFSKLSTISLFMGRRRLSMDKYLETSATKRKNRSSWTSFRKAGTLNLNQTEQTEVFLLHSASVRSRLKTIVSPDPHLIDVHAFDRNDDKTNNVLESNVKKLEDNQRYVYEEFPWRWNSELLGHPRPLPPAVLAEFDNHGESIVKFRRRKNTEEDHTIIPPDPITLAEVATFNLFFVSFTSVVGDLIIIPSNGTSCALDRSSVPPTNDFTKENSHVSSPRSTLDGADSSKISTETGPRDQTSDNESPVLVQSQSSQEMENTRDDSVCTITSSPRYETARLRFRHSLKYLEIEESKAKAKAALGLAFEILECMKLRKLKAEPESYHCLMDACGKCGDTQRVSQLLVRMHEDGIVADSAVYSSLVTAFSSDTVLNVTTTGIDESYLPEWANGVSFTIDWNKLSIVRAQKKSHKNNKAHESWKPKSSHSNTNSIYRILNKHRSDRNDDQAESGRYVTDSTMRQLLLGESVLEMVYPDIEINTGGQLCPRCNISLSDDDIIKGWSRNDPQDYTTKCNLCHQKFVPNFKVQTSLLTFRGSKGFGTPLFVQRLSPWVLGKELRTVINDNDGVDSLLDPKWREKETKNEVLWWNLVLSFMRFRLPFAYLLQGSVEQSLLAPSPSDDI